MPIAENLGNITQQIAMAVARRQNIIGTGSKVKLVAVTKNHDVEAVREVIDAGAVAVGENRVQEALTKIEVVNRQTEWHLIGHLQTNKVRQAVPLFNLIHSVDSERLALEINRVSEKIGKCQDVLIQVNAAGEESKSGITIEDIPALAGLINGLEHIRLCGLMTIAPFYADPEDARPLFKEMYYSFMELKDAGLANSCIEWLSMGMTNDYSVAVEEGANLVRIGTAIFGPRHYEEGVVK